MKVLEVEIILARLFNDEKAEMLKNGAVASSDVEANNFQGMLNKSTPTITTGSNIPFIPTNVATVNSFAPPKEKVILAFENLLDGLHMLNGTSFLAHTDVPSVENVSNKNSVGSPA
eukprot:2893091-Ditylum_brightwellii.AAC.1